MHSFTEDTNAKNFLTGPEVFVGGLSIKTTEEGLWSYMQSFGSIRSLKIKKFNGASRGFAYIVFDSEAAAAEVVGTEHVLDGKKFSCTYYVPDGLAQQKVKDEKNRKLFVNSLPSKATEGDILQYFQQFGAIERVSLNKEVDGKSKKSAFVLFECEQVAKRLLRRRHTAEHKIQGKKIFFFQSLTKKEIFEFSQKKNKPALEPQCHESTLAFYSNETKNGQAFSPSTSEDQETDHNYLKQQDQAAGNLLFYNSYHIQKPNEVFKHFSTDLHGSVPMNKPAFSTQPATIHIDASTKKSHFEVLDSTFGHDCLANFLKESNNVSNLHPQAFNLRFNQSTIAPYLSSRKFMADLAEQR